MIPLITTSLSRRMGWMIPLMTLLRVPMKNHVTPIDNFLEVYRPEKVRTCKAKAARAMSHQPQAISVGLVD